MKKLFIASLMMVCGIAAEAQTDNATLNVRLNPIQTLVVNAQQKTVDIDYVTKDHYKDGVSSTQNNHLNVFSTGGFEVKVKSAGDLINNATAGPNGNIDASSIKITALPGTQDPLTNNVSYEPTAILTGSENTIVSSTRGAVDRNIGVLYEAAGANAYIDKYVAGQTPTVFTTTVTYTIYAK